MTAGTGGAKATVLVVDDDLDIRDSLRELLELEGYHVVSAAGALAALEWIDHNGPPDVTLLDLMMPNVSGFELLDRLRQSGRSAGRVVVLSAYEGVDPGPVAAMVRKPVDIDDLLELLAELSAPAS